MTAECCGSQCFTCCAVLCRPAAMPPLCCAAALRMPTHSVFLCCAVLCCAVLCTRCALYASTDDPLGLLCFSSPSDPLCFSLSLSLSSAVSVSLSLSLLLCLSLCRLSLWVLSGGRVLSGVPGGELSGRQRGVWAGTPLGRGEVTGLHFFAVLFPTLYCCVLSIILLHCDVLTRISSPVSLPLCLCVSFLSCVSCLVSQEWVDRLAQRTVLKSRDSFFVPPGNIYRWER